MSSQTRPNITDWTDFTTVETGHACNTDNDETIRTPFTSVTVFRQAAESLQRIPSNEIFPPCHPDATIVTLEEANTAKCHIKRPKIGNYSWFQGEDTLAKNFLSEITVHELLEDNLHPNIVQFEGCIVNDGLITGICLKNYPLLLDSKFSADANDEPVIPPSTETIEDWMRDLRSATDHLHALDFAHNDLNPSNLMLDEEGKMVIIDLGACARLGEERTRRGRRGGVKDLMRGQACRTMRSA